MWSRCWRGSRPEQVTLRVRRSARRRTRRPASPAMLGQALLGGGGASPALVPASRRRAEHLGRPAPPRRCRWRASPRPVTRGRPNPSSSRALVRTVCQMSRLEPDSDPGASGDVNRRWASLTSTEGKTARGQSVHSQAKPASICAYREGTGHLGHCAGHDSGGKRHRWSCVGCDCRLACLSAAGDGPHP